MVPRELRTPVVYALAAGLALALLWSAPANGRLVGSVIYGGCSGNVPQGSTGGYNYRPVPGATVYITPIHGSTFRGSTFYGPTSSIVADKSAQFQIDLTPGVYRVQAGMDVLQFLYPNTPHRVYITGSTPLGVRIVSNTTVRADLGIQTNCA